MVTRPRFLGPFARTVVDWHLSLSTDFSFIASEKSFIRAVFTSFIYLFQFALKFLTLEPHETEEINDGKNFPILRFRRFIYLIDENTDAFYGFTKPPCRQETERVIEDVFSEWNTGKHHGA